ncbi:hypothetical protein CPB84DRAFT_1780696 [Gymnopilus junonius]|uniref:MYND-type domain-containing protein n=1 Tax=Gymnopilus junonius TaxID=109634 RepID=A0A9P5NLL3_GYMJU|nr:hypothetical protein CPB84DRAFT_1780696 [Gymnopilus junonius]
MNRKKTHSFLPNVPYPLNLLVKEFNSLPRREKAPSGRVSNEWHFDIRYVQIEPTPSHVLVLINPQSQFLHMERLPVGLPADKSGIAFFPESGKEAAPEIAKALLHSFVNNLRQGQFMAHKPPLAFAPWKLTTEDKDVAAEVGKELKRLGISPDALHEIGVSRKSVNVIMDEAFHKLFATVKKSIGISGLIDAVIQTPQHIGFSNFKLMPREPPRMPGETKEERRFNDALLYVQQLMNARPPKASDVETKVMVQHQGREMQLVLQRTEEKPPKVIKAEADRGDPNAAFDYGLRLLIGLGCKAQRTLARDYLIKALSAPDASDELKATAHGVLIDWYVSSCCHDFRSRYMFAASHHANLAARYCKLVSPKNVHASPAVLFFMSRVFETQAKAHMELNYWFKDAIAAYEFRNAQYASGKQKMEQKRLKNPNRYRCAAIGCGIEADSGSMLSKCAGECDQGKKPSYCSKECQKADWKNHKPFCKPGMPCSIIDTYAPGVLGSAGPSSKEGAIQMLREIRDYAQGADLAGIRSITMELERITM